MDSNKRACLAFIIGRAVNQNYQSVYDFGAGKLCMFTSSGSVDNIHVLDFQRNCIITGSLSNLYDMGTNSFTTEVHSVDLIMVQPLTFQVMSMVM